MFVPQLNLIFFTAVENTVRNRFLDHRIHIDQLPASIGTTNSVNLQRYYVIF